MDIRPPGQAASAHDDGADVAGLLPRGPVVRRPRLVLTGDRGPSVTTESRSPGADPYGMRLATAQLALAREWNVPTRTASVAIASWAHTLEVQVGVIVDLVWDEIVSRRRHGSGDAGADQD